MTILSVTASGLSLLVLGAGLAACGGEAAGRGADPVGLTDAVVTVRFQDSSVPPPYHRSWEVVVDRDDVTMVVTSYAAELARRTVPLAEADRAAFVAGLYDALDEIGTDDVGGPCPGGTSTELEVDDAGDRDRTVTAVPGCGADDDRGERTAAAIEALVAPYRDGLGLDAAIRTD